MTRRRNGDCVVMQGQLYEFSASRWLATVRGRVRAIDALDAQRRLLRRGYHRPDVWRLDRMQAWRSTRNTWGSNALPGLKVALRQEGYLVCGRNSLCFVVPGAAIIALGAVMSWFAKANWFFLGLGCAFCLLGLFLVLEKYSLVVDRARATMTLQSSVFFWRIKFDIPTANAVAIVLDRKDFRYENAVAFMYVVSLETSEGEQWPIDSSSFHATERELAEAIAMTLSVPLRDYGKGSSP